MNPGQDWCLQCGAGAPGSLSSGGWRSGAAILLGALVLALAAAGAAVAALSKGSSHTTTVAAVARVPSTTAPVTPAVPVTPAPSVTTTPVPKTAVTTPKIPVTPTVPKAATTPATTPTKTTTTSKETETSSNEGSEAQPSALLLDTNAASTYNPYGYPAAGFGDPSLTIDGDHSTAWTALVEPDKAPKMAVGVLLNLGSPQKLSEVELITTTPGMRVQVYGTSSKTAPNSITDPSWVPLSHSLVASKKTTKIKVLNKTKAVRLVVLWISAAPASAVGTEQAPGHVAVNEIELFPAS